MRQRENEIYQPHHFLATSISSWVALGAALKWSLAASNTSSSAAEGICCKNSCASESSSKKLMGNGLHREGSMLTANEQRRRAEKPKWELFLHARKHVRVEMKKILHQSSPFVLAPHLSPLNHLLRELLEYFLCPFRGDVQEELHWLRCVTGTRIGQLGINEWNR